MVIKWHDLILKPINLWNLPMQSITTEEMWNGGNINEDEEQEWNNKFNAQVDAALEKAGLLPKDNINPSHYKQGGVECIDALEAATVNLKGIEAVCTANAIKYLWRWKEKNGKEDLHKAQWYITKLLTNLAKS
jgi:hypothetical protein